MSKFIGVKMVEAVPMTAGEAAKKGYRTPVAESAMDLYIAGYEVTYEDGYKSWCPKDVFERNNVKIIEENIEDIVNIADNAPDFIKRMGIEHNELVDKYNKLNAFIFTDYFSTLSEDRRNRMIIQRNIMQAYISILQERIDNDVVSELVSK